MHTLIGMKLGRKVERTITKNNFSCKNREIPKNLEPIQILIAKKVQNSRRETMFITADRRTISMD